MRIGEAAVQHPVGIDVQQRRCAVAPRRGPFRQPPRDKAGELRAGVAFFARGVRPRVERLVRVMQRRDYGAHRVRVRVRSRKPGGAAAPQRGGHSAGWRALSGGGLKPVIVPARGRW